MRRAVKITNKTAFCTRAIRSLVLAVARRELKSGQYKNLVVEIGHPRRDYVTGKALISRTGATASFAVYIPKDQTDVVEVAHRVKVCLDYVRGRYGYKDGTSFRDWYKYTPKPADYQYLQGHSLTKAVAKPQKASGAEAALEGMKNAEAKVEYWEGRVRRAQNKLRKWKRRLQYYGTRSAELGKKEAEKKEANSMTAEQFSQLPPVNEQ